VKEYRVKEVSILELEPELSAFSRQGFVIENIFHAESVHRFIIVASMAVDDGGHKNSEDRC
jgi:hypothetical protein